MHADEHVCSLNSLNAFIEGLYCYHRSEYFCGRPRSWRRLFAACVFETELLALTVCTVICINYEHAALTLYLLHHHYIEYICKPPLYLKQDFQLHLWTLTAGSGVLIVKKVTVATTSHRFHTSSSHICLITPNVVTEWKECLSKLWGRCTCDHTLWIEREDVRFIWLKWFMRNKWELDQSCD